MRQAATIKGDIGRYVNEGNDVTTAIQLKTAIESGPGSCAKASYVTFNPSSTRHVKWDGVSLLNNFKYEENGIRAWRAFNVGLESCYRGLSLKEFCRSFLNVVKMTVHIIYSSVPSLENS